MGQGQSIQPISKVADQAGQFGARAAKLAMLMRIGLPVPNGLALSFDATQRIGRGESLSELPKTSGFVALRTSPGEAAWGGVPAMLNLGVTSQTLPGLEAKLGRKSALDVFRRGIMSYGVRVHGLDPEDFENLYYDQLKLSKTLTETGLEELVKDSLALYHDEVGEAFPENPDKQVQMALRAMVKAWSTPTARILRMAKGAPEEAPLGLMIQKMVFGLGPENGAGALQMVDEGTGASSITGRFLPDALGQDATTGLRTPHLATVIEREAAGQTLPSLEEMHPDGLSLLKSATTAATKVLSDAQRLEFTLIGPNIHVLDAIPARRTSRATVRIAVDLAKAGVISREDAVLRIEPGHLAESLHPQVDPYATRTVLGTGLAASPGAATGKIVFTPEAAQAAQSQGDPAILVRFETSPEDIRGMHSAVAVLTVRGGMTSHAAVIARGLGLPCVVGASDLRLDLRKGMLTTAAGETLVAGDIITIDGTAGQALAGAPKMTQAEMTGAFTELMNWADEMRSMGVRANADTTQDAEVARNFKVDGIGLCRTEHMFFQDDRIDSMREMILANSTESRQDALAKLLDMQRKDFTELLRTMAGMPVTIRLLDPPLHEFLPHSEEEIATLATAMNLPVEEVMARAEDLHEFNPMLGKRGVRVGVTMPEIYEMQARAIFEAVVALQAEADPPVPEIMIPLVSATREVELIKDRVDAVARDVRASSGVAFAYDIGVMIETPRGALRAGDIARHCTFFSFGTNDLTQMTYGLSRDDAGRFMRDYVNLGVFTEDPFHSLDIEGVGELVLLATSRAREANPDIKLGLCGEHGGDPASIRFCKIAGFDYVSCSPFRVPIARLAAAQASLLSR